MVKSLLTVRSPAPLMVLVLTTLIKAGKSALMLRLSTPLLVKVPAAVALMVEDGLKLNVVPV